MKKKNNKNSSKKSLGRPPKRPRRRLWPRLLKYTVMALLTLAVFLFLIILYYAHDLPDVSHIEQIQHQPTITVRAADGTVLAKYGDAYGRFLRYEQIPPYLIQAVLATEDRRFFHHSGIDFWGIMRAFYTNQRHGKIVQGASTITQQLAKIAFLSSEKTFKRKVQEILLAVQLERQYSKQRIFCMYLNRAYFGQGNFGIDAASKYYFGKYPEKLQLYEAAVLAGMLKSPTKYAPTTSPHNSISRAKQVLANMVDAGLISPQVMRASMPASFVPRGRQRGALYNPYFADYILEILPQFTPGLHENITVYTTFDLKLQHRLEKAVYKHLNQERKNHDLQAAGIIMQTNGAIKAMLGGVDYRESQFNRATAARRQPGSTFKLYVYLAALEAGVKISDTVLDAPLNIHGWQPHNFSRTYLGKVTVEQAFAKSLNTPAIRLSEQTGRQNVISMARKLGMRGKFPDVPSIALGVRETSLLTLTQGFAHLANNGMQVMPYAITKITDDRNRILFQHRLPAMQRILAAHTVRDMETLLMASTTYGTSQAAKLAGKGVYGKTGTSQNFRDAWFVGYQDKLVTGIWAGYDNKKATSNITGGTLPAHIWRDFMEN